MSNPYGWPLLQAFLDEQARRFDYRRARVCRTCRGRGQRRRVPWWRGFKTCRVCHGRGMLGGR
jgi:DnaJ-class molecular chaperone